jgi:hypothetical protein
VVCITRLRHSIHTSRAAFALVALKLKSFRLETQPTEEWPLIAFYIFRSQRIEAITCS